MKIAYCSSGNVTLIAYVPAPAPAPAPAAEIAIGEAGGEGAGDLAVRQEWCKGKA